MDRGFRGTPVCRGEILSQLVSGLVEPGEKWGPAGHWSASEVWWGSCCAFQLDAQILMKLAVGFGLDWRPGPKYLSLGLRLHVCLD